MPALPAKSRTAARDEAGLNIGQGLLSLGLALLIAADRLAAAADARGFGDSTTAADAVVTFNEALYHPTPAVGGIEWIELHNQLSVDVDLSGWSIAGGIQFRFPAGTWLAAGGYVVVAADPTAGAAVTGLDRVLGPFTGRLANEGDRLFLRNLNGRLMDRLDYGVDPPWPVGADGSGATLAKRVDDSPSSPPENWRASAAIGGTPGRANAPRDLGGTRPTDALVGPDALARWRVPVAADAPVAWRQPGFDDSKWALGTNGFGFDLTGAVPGARADRYYPLDSEAADRSGQNRNGWVHGGVTWSSDTPAGLAGSTGSARFDGVDAEIGIDEPVVPSAYTLALWVRVESVRTSSLLVLTSAAGPLSDYSHQLLLNAEGRFLHYTWDGTPNLVVSRTVAQPGRWYHVAASAQNGGPARLYVDGVEEGTPDPIGSLWSGGTRWVLGSASGQAPAHFKGSIDDAAIWFTVLSPGQIRTLASGGSPLDSGGVTGLFQTDLGAFLHRQNSSLRLRVPFNVPALARYDHLELDLRYNDGFIAWLDGSEVARRGAPADTDPAWNVAATAPRPPGAAATPEPIELTSWLARLTPGPHVLALQGLNQTADDPNFLIQVQLLARQASDVGDDDGPRFSEVPPVGTLPFWVELANPGRQPLDPGSYLLRSSRGESRSVPPASLGPGELARVDDPVPVFGLKSGDCLFLLTADGLWLLDAVRVSTQAAARRPGDRSGDYLRPAELTPGLPNAFTLHDEIVINEILYHAPPTYRQAGVPAQTTPRQVLRWTDIWRYDDSGTDRGTAWSQAGFDDSRWPAGPGILGYRTGPLAEPIRTPIRLGLWTHYFRTPFVLETGETGGGLQLRLLVDDGAVFYVNGRELYRHKMPDGDVLYATPAINVGDPPVVGPVILVATNLVAGTNWLAAEVHQWNVASSDVVFGAELWVDHAVQPGTPDTPFAENDQQWIELHNRSDHAVDLSGWQLADAVRFLFPAGTRLEPGGLLVVARDAAALRAEHPDIAVVGNFNGRLSHRADTLRLLDAQCNLADQVRYADASPWPAAADGGGSTLELGHPAADNAAPGAWAASRQFSRARWRHYEYTARAVEPVFGPPLNGFSELRLGLLDAGEVLLDNVSVVEDPAGTARELILDGTFSGGAAGWRLLGNHSHSAVIDNPDRPGDPVLRLVATGARTYLHNHLETTLESGGAVVPVPAGRTYRIAFDAKWVSGSPQLHTELYYNRVAHTTILETPSHPGTPGRTNSVFTANPGPTYADLTHAPAVPKPGAPVTVSVVAADPDGIDRVSLRYSVQEGPWQERPMADLGEGRFTATLAAPALEGSVIQFYVLGRDRRGAESAWPAAGPESRALIRVDSRLPGPRRRAFHLILLGRDGQTLDRFENMLSDDRLGATVVWDDREIAYDCGVHLHGSMFSRNNPDAAAYNIRFPADRLHRGVHRAVQTKRRVIQEILAKHAQNQAGLPGMYEDIVHLFSHRPGNAGAARLSLAQYHDIFLESQFENGADGTLFKMEGIRVAQATDDGTPRGGKLPFPIDWVGNYDITNLGNDPEQYRWSTLILNHRDRDDYAPYIALAKAFDLTGTALTQTLPRVADVDEWLRLFALMSLFGIGDAYTQGNPHNLDFYVRPADGRVLAFPYDWDFFFALDPTAPLWGNQNLGRIISVPSFTRAFHGHLLDLIETSFTPESLAPWVEHYGTVAGEDYSYVVDRVRARAAYVRSRLPAAVPFEVTSNGGADFAVATPSVTLDGRGWIDVAGIRRAGGAEPLPVEWLDASRWRLVLPLPATTNLLRLEAFNRRGEPVGQDSLTVTTTRAEDSQCAFLRITELMYHPGPPTDAERAAGYTDADAFEFIELGNFGPADVSLLGVRLTVGVQFDFTGSACTNLAPGGRVLVVRNPAAFAVRYSTGRPIAGPFGGALDNGGERIRLVDRYGLVIEEFVYGDRGGWPGEADGNGPSLEAVRFDIDAAQPSHWQASPSPGGSPGRPELVRPVFATVAVESGAIRLEFAARPGQSYRLEASDGLAPGAWRLVRTIPPGDAARLVELTDPVDAAPQPRFYRLGSP
jgi:hypothetical protein